MSKYYFTVQVERAVEKQLKDEQARRVLRGDKKPTIPGLAAELIIKGLKGIS